MANQFTYFTQLLMFVLMLYVLVLSVFLCVRRNEIKNRLEFESVEERMLAEDERFTFSWTTRVDDVVDSSLGAKARPFLFALRVIFCLFVLLSGIIVPAASEPIAFYFFDGWALCGVFVYFAVAVALTVIKYYKLKHRSEVDVRLGHGLHWARGPRAAAVGAHLLFEVSGANLIASVFINYCVELQSTSTVLRLQVAIVLGLLALELAFNNLRVRFDQLPAAVGFLLFYLMCMWPAVFTGSVADWPYGVMRTDSRACFLNYLLLVLGAALSYAAWYLLYKLKKIAMHFVTAEPLLAEAAGAGGNEDEASLSAAAVAQAEAEAEEAAGYGYGYGGDAYYGDNGFDPSQQSNSYYGGYPPSQYNNSYYPDPGPGADQYYYPAHGSVGDMSSATGAGAGGSGYGFQGYFPAQYQFPPPAYDPQQQQQQQQPPQPYYDGYEQQAPQGDYGVNYSHPPPAYDYQQQQQVHYGYPPPNPYGYPPPNPYPYPYPSPVEAPQPPAPVPAPAGVPAPPRSSNAVNPLYRRRGAGVSPSPPGSNPSPSSHAPLISPMPPARLARTPTAMFGNQDDDVNAFAFGFGDF